MEKYLYGAAVQGIQSFIFQTNELQDIVGASELVEEICTSEFEKYAEDGDSILRAAGNIKHIFNSKKECEKAVLDFPMKVMTAAPGITISQAVVKMDDESTDFAEAVNELERRLRMQRNCPMPSTTIGLMGVKRSAQTGLPLIKGDKGELLDAAKKAKQDHYDRHALCQKAFGANVPSGKFPFNISDITSKNDWIAIIHADGNGLGQVVQKVGKSPEAMKNFSASLDKATIAAAQEAWQRVSSSAHFGEAGGNSRYPLRPVVLGGDDLTVICRADFAVEYATAFMQAFEEQTEAKLGNLLKEYNVFGTTANRLTACAGIAFIKSSYPFYYGYELAEALCGEAKKSSKTLNPILSPSCLMFHKVQDSFVESFDKIESRELTAGEVSFKYGPYYTNETDDQPTVAHLLDRVDLLATDDGNKIKSHLRQWLTALIDSQEVAEQKAERVRSLLSDGGLKLLFDEATTFKEGGEDKEGKAGMKTSAYDILALASVKHQVTK